MQNMYCDRPKKSHDNLELMEPGTCFHVPVVIKDLDARASLLTYTVFVSS
jgi:hypothetical protein